MRTALFPLLVVVISSLVLGQETLPPGRPDRGSNEIRPQQSPAVRRPVGGPYAHQVLSASSRDGVTWTRDDGVRLEHASVPCAVVFKDRIFLYFVDANRGEGQEESVGCAVSDDGLRFDRQKLVIDGMTARKAVDPSILIDREGKFRLYYFASSARGDPARDESPHEIHLATSDDGIRFRNVGKVFSHADLVDPDVFFFKDAWFMYVFARGDTLIATSPDGRDFTYKGPLALRGWGTVAPIPLDDGRLRLYAFDQRKQRANSVRSFLSKDGLEWTAEEGDRLAGAEEEQITDPYVIRFKDAYKMYFKIERRTGDRPGPGPQGNGPRPDGEFRGGDQRPRVNAGRQPLPAQGPWNNDVLVHRASPAGDVTKIATFERAGVPTIARLKDGRLIAAHQHFPADNEADFDKVAVHFSTDEAKTWTKAEVIRLKGLPDGMRFPFDPTLVPLPDGRIRLYFTSNQRRELGVPAIYSAISDNGIDFTVEPGMRFGIEGRPVIDCAVVLHHGIFHLYSPDNGAQRRGDGPGNRPGQMQPADGLAYHATSKDGLEFKRIDDVTIEGRRRWLGNASSDGKTITFIGTGDPGRPPGDQRPRNADGQRGGIWMATSADGAEFTLIKTPAIPGADPGAVRATDGGWIIVSTGPPRAGTAGPRQPGDNPGE